MIDILPPGFGLCVEPVHSSGRSPAIEIPTTGFVERYKNLNNPVQFRVILHNMVIAANLSRIPPLHSTGTTNRYFFAG